VALSVGTIENRSNAEITKDVIFVKCQDFAKMLCFSQNAAILPFYKKFLQ